MLGEAPYPYPGSYALWPDEGQAQLARILELPTRREIDDLVDTREATITLPLRPGIGSGHKRVPLGQLIEAAPLSTAELAEYEQLLRKRRAIKRSGRRPKVSKRFEELARRADEAACLAALKTELNLRMSRAA